MERLKKYCLVAGKGNGQHEIASFDAALLDARVGEYNLVRVSSILPPYCEESSVIRVASGAILFIAYASLTVKEAVKIASAVAVAIPEKPESHGVIMEYSDYADKDIVVKTAEHLAKDAMHKRGIPLKNVLSIGVDAYTNGEDFCTTFAGIALYD